MVERGEFTDLNLDSDFSKITPKTMLEAVAIRCIRGRKRPEEIESISTELREELQRFFRYLGKEESSFADEEDTIEEDRRLRKYFSQYGEWRSEDRRECPWERVRERLLADNGHFLALASAMENGGVLFGVDSRGNPLIADDGKGPILIGMNYIAARRVVCFRKDQKGRKPSGYSLFPSLCGQSKGDEILTFEDFTGRPFVVSPKGDKPVSSWVESGNFSTLPQRVCGGGMGAGYREDFWPNYARFNPEEGYVEIRTADDTWAWDNKKQRGICGVRRLLRLEKKSPKEKGRLAA